MMQTDVKAVYITASGANAYAGPTRLKGLYVNASGAATIEFTDGGTSGTSRFKIDMPASATGNPVSINLPGEGVQFTSTLYVKTLTGVNSITVFYG